MSTAELNVLLDQLKNKETREIRKIGTNKVLELLENLIDNFDYNKEYNQISDIFDVLAIALSKNQDTNKEKIYKKLKEIHAKTKILIYQKPGNLDKKNKNFQNLKNIISNIEAITLSYLYDYMEKYQNNTYSFINFLIFETKNLVLLDDAISRFPHIVNLKDENDVPLVEKVIDKYIQASLVYTSDKELKNNDDLVYYDEVLEKIFKSDEFQRYFLLKQSNLHKINNIIESITKDKYNDLTKRKLVFWLNNLKNRIVNEKQDDEEFSVSNIKYKYDIRDSFDEGILSEVRQKKKNLSKSCLDGRTIISQKEYIITIDGDGAEEIDDGLSAVKLANGNYLLGVHIADPLGIIPLGNIIFEEAIKRTTSIYLSDKVIPQFPEEISKNMISLKSRSNRLANTYYMEISPNGELVNMNFVSSVVFVSKKMSYKLFNKMANEGIEDPHLEETILTLQEISNILSKKIKIDDVYFDVTRSEPNTTNTNIIGNTCAEKIVANSMIMTNHVVANYFRERGLPFIYRNHQVNKELQRKLEYFRNNLYEEKDGEEYKKYIEAIEDMYPKSYYSTECDGHFGLNLDAYSHVTSPIRRTADVVSNLCLNELVYKNPTDKKIYELEKYTSEICEHINSRQTTISHFSKKYEKIKR